MSAGVAGNRFAAAAMRAAPALMLGTLAVTGGVLGAEYAARPLVLGAIAGGVLVVAGVGYAVRRLGPLLFGIAVTLLAIVAGEMGAVAAGGQSGRLLWADGLIVAGVLAALAWGRGRIALPRAPHLDALWPFLLWCAITILPSEDPLTAVAEYKEWIMAAILGAAVVIAARDAVRAQLVLAAVALTGVVTSAMMIVVALTSPLGAPLAVMLKVVDLPWGRTNYLAGLIILAIPILLGFLGDAVPRRARALAFLALPVAMAGLAVSASKGAIIAMALSLAVAFGLPRRQARAPRALLLALLAIGVTVYVAGPLHQVTAMRLQESALDYSASERMDLYRLAWNEFARHPILGLGLNDFSVASHRFHGVDTVPHNLELGFLAELGLPGLALALLWVATLFAGPWRALRHARTPGERSLALGLFAAMLGFVLHNQFESTLYGQQYKMMLLAVAGAAFGLARAWERRSAALTTATPAA